MGTPGWGAAVSDRQENQVNSHDESSAAIFSACLRMVLASSGESGSLNCRSNRNPTKQARSPSRKEYTVRPSSYAYAPPPSCQLLGNELERLTHCPHAHCTHCVLLANTAPIVIETSRGNMKAVGLRFQARCHTHISSIGGPMPIVMIPDILADRMPPERVASPARQQIPIPPTIIKVILPTRTLFLLIWDEETLSGCAT